MLVNDFLKKVAVRLGDEARVTYSNKELISALNDAHSTPLARVATALIANKIDEAVALADYFIGTTFKKQEIKEVTI